MFQNNGALCQKCQEKFKILLKSFKVFQYRATYVYEYDENIKAALFQFKGCYDYELAPIFLYRNQIYFKLKYRNYILIPMPSFYKHNEDRGFNHVIEMFKSLSLKIVDVLEKTADRKQTDVSAKERSEIRYYMKVKKTVDLSNKNILLIDDVYTTGSTIKSAIRLIEQFRPKTIEILVMAKTMYG